MARCITDNTPAYSGTAEAGSTVTVIVDGVPVGTITADASGNWSFTPTTALAEGTHTVKATATDAVGNTSPDSNTNTFTVDTHAPAAPGGRHSGGRLGTNDTTPTFSGTAEPGSTVTVIVDGTQLGTTTADAAGNWTLHARHAAGRGPVRRRAPWPPTPRATPAPAPTSTASLDTTVIANPRGDQPGG